MPTFNKSYVNKLDVIWMQITMLYTIKLDMPTFNKSYVNKLDVIWMQITMLYTITAQSGIIKLIIPR